MFESKSFIASGSMTNVPAWITVLSALLTPLIAIGVAYVAWRQFHIARAKLGLDLFDRRMGVYRKVRKAVATVNTQGRSDREADVSLLEAIEESQFLFGAEVTQYLNDKWHEFVRLQLAHSQLESRETQVREAAATAQGELFQRITSFYDSGSQVFAPYMRMDQKVR